MTQLARTARTAGLAAVLLLTATSLASASVPTAGPLTVSAVTHDSARVAGSVERGTGATSWRVEYGSSVASYRTTAPIALGSGSGSQSVAATLSGLPAATLIYARLVADMSGSPYHGTISSFTTSAAPAPAPTDPTPVPFPPAGPGPGTEPILAPAPTPALGETVVVAVARGTVRVRLPGGGGFAQLAGAQAVPVGSVVDARNGSITLSSAGPDGTTQEATFGGGRFAVLQADDPSGFVDLHLRGRLRGCTTRAGASGARTLASASAKPRKSKRRLWGKDDHGRFRTHGRDSVATVRGTTWSMTDRCDGTVTKVSEGAVDVKVRRTGRVVRVDAGERHFARHRR